MDNLPPIRKRTKEMARARLRGQFVQLGSKESIDTGLEVESLAEFITCAHGGMLTADVPTVGFCTIEGCSLPLCSECAITCAAITCRRLLCPDHAVFAGSKFYCPLHVPSWFDRLCAWWVGDDNEEEESE